MALPENPDMLTHERFTRCFLGEERVLRAFLLSATGNAHQTDDLIQNVASVLWEKREQFDPSRPFRAWAMGIARMELLKLRQRTARSREVLSDEAVGLLCEAAQEHAAIIDERLQYLLDCIQVLPSPARQVIQMKYGSGLPASEIAERIGKKVPSVAMALVRARKALRDCIGRKMAHSGKGMPC